MFVLIFLGITACAIVKHYLFGIKVLLTKALVGAMGIVLMILLFLMKNLLLRISTIGIFFLFCVIGYLLIRYSYQEVRQKEILEERVKERTKELEKAKDIAEEKTREIEKCKIDLEHFYKFAVGRELKMIELKKKIKETEEGKKEKTERK